ncbi:hypothetical protein L2E82_24761 [Cichorium intybus]|uniref:Uncharacterized protein n=1 Tax=Cichorium intybus TaxID=13427 RepID=A0ACB9E212_CICIN|nr:hypothetical protein L2E82_24761 [Cichorium intybus]
MNRLQWCHRRWTSRPISPPKWVSPAVDPLNNYWSGSGDASDPETERRERNGWKIKKGPWKAEEDEGDDQEGRSTARKGLNAILYHRHALPPDREKINQETELHLFRDGDEMVVVAMVLPVSKPATAESIVQVRICELGVLDAEEDGGRQRLWS